jgi:predicted metal-dependent hydrolase
MYLNVNGTRYKIIILKKNNKNTYIRVKEDLNIYISTNKRTSDKQIQKLIEKNYDDIVKMINSKKQKSKELEKNWFLGSEIGIVVVSNQKKPELYNNKLYIKDRSKVDIYYKSMAYDVFKERLDIIFKLFNEYIPYPE